MTDVTRKCVFCQTELSGKRAAEHVFPRWLLRELNIEGEVIAATHLKANPQGFEKEPVSVRRLSLGGLVEGRVCSGCNGGWMSQLEQQVIPILGPLIKGTLALPDLTRQKRLLIARWAVKTAFVLNHSANFNLKVPNDHLQSLFSQAHRLPSRVLVVAHYLRFEPTIRWNQNSTWVVLGKRSQVKHLARKLKTRSYKITLYLGGFLMLVLWCPWPKLSYALFEGIHFPLWVGHEQVRWYVLDDYQFPSQDPRSAAVDFAVLAHLVPATQKWLRTQSLYTHAEEFEI